MKSEEEIRALLKDWKELKGCLLDCGDTVSLIVAEQPQKNMNIIWMLSEVVLSWCQHKGEIKNVTT